MVWSIRGWGPLLVPAEGEDSRRRRVWERAPEVFCGVMRIRRCWGHDLLRSAGVEVQASLVGGDIVDQRGAELVHVVKGV